jgi:LysR family hydrogen peroxide-inducible transcriptional activator
MSDSVEFRHLEYLLAIYEGKNFTKAAQRLYRSQPAVSQQVRALEEDVEFPIFVCDGASHIQTTSSSLAARVLFVRQPASLAGSSRHL